MGDIPEAWGAQAPKAASDELLRYRWLGTGGSAALSLASGWAGVLPVYQPLHFWFDAQPMKNFVMATLGYAGLIVLVICWWRLGRLTSVRSAVSGRDMVITFCCWATPLAFAAPLFSRDVYSYAAQGAMAARGWDVYTAGPSLLGGPLTASVASLWRDTPAPYGPLFVWLADHVVQVTGENVLAAVMGMRVVALLGVALIVWAVRRLAVATGVCEAGALWLAALNPLVLMHLVGGSHNDAVMLGLMLSGLVLARQGRLVWGAAVITLAMLVKAPAGLALLFLLPERSGGRGGLVRRATVVAVTAVATVVTATAVLGYGYGWLSALSTPVSSGRLLSLTSNIGAVLGAFAHQLGLASSPTLATVVRMAGLAVGLAAVPYWLWRTRRLGPERAVGMALLTVVILSPAVQPWYFLWGLLPIAATFSAGPIRTRLAAASIGLLFATFPCGQPPDAAYVVCCCTGAVLALVALYHWEPISGSSWRITLTYRESNRL
jgi:alpha-1,6-mannosyltransferase